MKKTNDLYAMAKPKTQKKETPEDLEYERVCDECTFTPDITATKNKNLYVPKRLNAKNVGKTIEKMRISRKQRVYVDWWKEGRGGYDFPKFDPNFNDFTMKTRIEISKLDPNNNYTTNNNNNNTNQNDSKQNDQTSLGK